MDYVAKPIKVLLGRVYSVTLSGVIGAEMAIYGGQKTRISSGSILSITSWD